MIRYRTGPQGRRAAARLLLVGALTAVMAASPLTTAPASAGSPERSGWSPGAPGARVSATTCTAFKSGFSAATGSCQDPASHLSFRVIALCRHAVTHVLYNVFSPLVPTSQTVHVFCGASAFTDPILDWDTQIVQTGEPDPPPVIHSFNCQVTSWIFLACNLSASDWTQIRWRVDGDPVSMWNNQTSVEGNCRLLAADSDHSIQLEIRSVPVRVTVSNAAGSTVRQVSPSCLVNS